MMHRHQLTGLALVFAAGFGMSPAHALGQDQATPSMTGTWEVAVQARGRLGSTPEVLTLIQHADGSLAGAFVVESLRKEEPISDGRIDGDRFSFTRVLAESRYEGMIDGDEIQGTMTYQSGTQTLSHSFSGTRTSTDVISFAPPPPPPSAQVPTPGGDAAAAAPVPTPGGDAAPLPSSLTGVPDPEPGQGILSIDGVARSFSVNQCLTNNEGQKYLGVSGRDDGGSLSLRAIEHPGTNQQFSVFLDGRAQFQALYLQQFDGSWTSNGQPVEGPLFRIDGSTVTASGTFIASGREFEGEHTLTVSFECPDQAPPAGWDRDVTTQVQPVGEPTTPTPPPAAPTPPAAVTDLQPGQGILTVDGETLSFALDSCTRMSGDSVIAGGTSEQGQLFFRANASTGWAQIGAGNFGAYNAEGSLVTIDGSELSFKGTFVHGGDQTEHEVELRFVCEGA